MMVCPNKSSAEWKALVDAVGEFEAFRDFIENSGEIRTPEVVLDKLNNPSVPILETDFALNESSPEVPEGSEELNTLTGNALVNNPQYEMNAEVNDNTEALEVATQMSEQMGVDFDVITYGEAIGLTENSQNPWNGERAFFMGDKVYLVGENFTKEDVFHEFSHPIVRAISKDNSKLFNRLFEKLQETPEGLSIIGRVRETYPELDINSDLFKEEAIVRALTEAGTKAGEGIQTEKGFGKVVKDIMYAIKQFLRKIFGQKVAVSKLSPTTTLEELGEMLTKGEQFEIDTEGAREEDIVAYARDQSQEIEDLQDLPNQEVQALINRGYEIASGHIRELQNNENYSELGDILLDEYGEGELQQLRKDVQNYQTLVSNKANEMVNELEYRQKQVGAFVNMMYRLETVLAKIEAQARDIRKFTDSQDALAKAYYFDHLVKTWQGFINEVEEAINDADNDISHDSAIGQVANKVSNLIKRTKSTINAMYADGARDTLYAELEPMSNNIKNRYENIIENLKKRNAPQSTIDRWHKKFYGLNQAEYAEYQQLDQQSKAGRLASADKAKYEKMKNTMMREGLEITPEKIEYILKGEIGDANFFNSYLEGYMYSADPIIGGLALHVKNKMNEVMANAQAKYNDFMSDMEEDLKKIGYNPHKPGDLGKSIGFLDTIGREEKGEFEERQVWTLLNQFKNYRHDYDKLKYNKRKAHENYSMTGAEEDRVALLKAISEVKEFEARYMNRKYVDEFYALEEIFERDDIGREAAYRRESNYEARRLLMSRITNESDRLAVAEQIESLDAERRAMYSLVNLDGSPKTGIELAITERLLEYRDASLEFYEWNERPNAFSNAYQSYMQELADSGMQEGSEEWIAAEEAWLRRNTKTELTDEYYEERERIISQIRDIVSRLPGVQQQEADKTERYERMYDLIFTVRDSLGVPNGNNLSDELIAEIKDIQQELLEMQKESKEIPGLDETQARMNELLTMKSQGVELSDSQKEELNDLFKKRQELYDTYTVSGDDKAFLSNLYRQLASLSSKEVTDYYIDTMNYWLAEVQDKDMLKETTGSYEALKDSVSMILGNQELLSNLLEQNDGFREWFMANHVQKEVYNRETEEMDLQWIPLAVWTVSRPDPSTGDKYFKSTNITDETGATIKQVRGVPSSRFMTRNVKEQYNTKQVVGVTVDNKGNWLPKTIEQGASDDRYINEQYNALKREDPDRFRVLQKMTKHHLDNQEGLGNRSKLYMDFPRYRKSTLEVVQTKNVAKEKWNAMTIYAKRVRDFFTGAKDDAEGGLNYNEDFDLVRTDMFDNEISNVPMYGLYDIEPDDVSTDITHSMMRYMLQAERHKQLVEISPFARAVQAVVNDPNNGIKEVDKINKFNLVHRAVKSYRDKKGLNVRKNAVNNFIEREFEGQTMAGHTQNVAWLNNTANLLFKRASFSFFALNIPSALKNSFGAKFQGMIEASAGEYMNHATFARGEGWAMKAMTKVSAEIYKKGPKSLEVQMIELFDPSQGRFEDKFGESMSRTISKDVANFSWLYNFRRWVELEATMQTYAGMMYHTKVERTLEDGTVKKIPYMDAWQVVDGKVQLKSGVDPEWGVTYDEDGKMKVGKKFSQERNKIHQVMNNLQGAYAKFDQPEAQRYIGFRFLSYLRRYFTTMAVNRWGKTRLNPGLNDIHQGYYITFMQTLKDTVLRLGRNLPYMTPQEKRAALKVITEVTGLMATVALMPLLFGWDPDDEEKYAKLRDKSGALPFPFAPSDPDRPFNAWGYMENHALFLMMNIRAENEQFLPFPGYGLDDYDALLDLKSIAFGPTTHTYAQLLDDATDIAYGNESAYYARDVGPYTWQREGGTKFWAHLGVALGLTGSSVDPVKAIKGFQSVQSRGR